MSEPVTLSSGTTLLYKMVFPSIWICGFGYGAIDTWMSTDIPVAVKYGFIALWCVGCITLWRICAPLKEIRIDERNLYISNYLKEITAPLVLIERVTENRRIRGHPVTIHFRSDTEFGNKTVFMPKVRYAGDSSSHPVVGEIERLAKAAAAGNAS